MLREDLRGKPYEEKVRRYEELHHLFLQGKKVKVREHKSGFPAVTVDCEEIHLLTDILSIEQWYPGKKDR